MNVVRGLERRLEHLLQGVTGRVFSGRLHPSEIAGRLAREADFARFDHETGPATANRYHLIVNPQDLQTDSAEVSRLEAEMTRAVDEYAIEEGLRLEGPAHVSIDGSFELQPGNLTCRVEVVPGPPVMWASIVGRDEAFEVGRTRAMVGRATEADTQIPHEEISRRHAVIARQSGRYWVRDLNSANGTAVNGHRVGSELTPLENEARITFADHHYRFVVD